MVGKSFSHYEVDHQLVGGGMGRVYRTEGTNIKRTVALKSLPPELSRDADTRERQGHEAQAATALDHPNICTIPIRSPFSVWNLQLAPLSNVLRRHPRFMRLLERGP
jgi:serine/threonine protein kinase